MDLKIFQVTDDVYYVFDGPVPVAKCQTIDDERIESLLVTVKVGEFIDNKATNTDQVLKAVKQAIAKAQPR